MDKDIELVMSYQGHGIIAGRKSEEMTWLFVENSEWMDERIECFEKALKKAIGSFNKKSIYNLEIRLYRSTRGEVNENLLALLCREAGDEENDIYTLYKYDKNATDTIKVSKAKAIKELLAIEQSNVKLLLNLA